MPKYRVLEKSFINNTLYGPGEAAGDIVEYDGKPGKALELVKGGRRKAKEGEQETEGDEPEVPADDTEPQADEQLA